MTSAKCCHEELISAMFLKALQDHEKLDHWAVPQLHVDPPAKLPELVTSVMTVHQSD
jgi:hypothetical protein